MTKETADQIQRMIRDHLTSEVDCQLLESDGRVGCVTPLELPNGDRVVVWVRSRNGTLEVTDYGDAMAEFAPYKGQERAKLEDFARVVCRGQDIEYDSGRLTVRCEWNVLGEFVWRVATAIAQVAQAAQAHRPHREPSGSEEFVREVERIMRERNVPVERERKVQGRSGHTHRATIFVPTSHSVVEPVTGHMNQVNATYTKFGDLMNANGYKLYALLDDRGATQQEDIEALLVQVSRVIGWSRHDEWLDSVT